MGEKVGAMTSYEGVRETVADSDIGDWIPFSEMGTWTYEHDVQLRIVRHEQLQQNFQAPWTAGLQAGSASYGYIVYYGNSPVEYHVVVSVDNYRAHIPQPQQPAGPNRPYTITPYQANLGRIVTGDRETFDAYCNRTGVEVQA